MTHFADALTAMASATNQVDLNAVYATHITRLILNGASRSQLRYVATAWQGRSLQLLDEQMDGDDK